MPSWEGPPGEGLSGAVPRRRPLVSVRSVASGTSPEPEHEEGTAMSKDKQGREAKKPKKGKAVTTAPKPVIPQSPRA